MLPKAVWTSVGLGVGVAALAAVTATGALGGSAGSRTSAATAKPTLAVVVVGSGRVTSNPGGISCPGKCAAVFAAGSRVLLAPASKSGSRLLRWGGGCTGAGACRVRVSALVAVAAEFVGTTAQTRPPAQSSLEPGTYSGRGLGGYPVTFFVPTGAGSVLTFSIPNGGARVNCAGGGSYDTPFMILKATIRRDRSFTARTAQKVVVGGANATINYLVTGRSQGRSAVGAGTVEGVYREDVVFTDTPNRKCTSNDQPFTAARTLPPPGSSIDPGNYSGRGLGGYPVTFLVPAGAASMLNFSLPNGGARVNCAGGGSYDTPFTVARATIKPDRSFTATATQNGVVNGANAKLTYFVTGYFQSPNTAGAMTASGVYREEVVFTDTPNRKCTSNDQPFTAARSG